MKSKEELKEIWYSRVVARVQAAYHLERVIEFERGAKARHCAEGHLRLTERLEKSAWNRLRRHIGL